eukprot:5995970-Lingulodinium_polyedra.AAC.1
MSRAKWPFSPPVDCARVHVSWGFGLYPCPCLGCASVHFWIAPSIQAHGASWCSPGVDPGVVQ